MRRFLLSFMKLLEPCEAILGSLGHLWGALGVTFGPSWALGRSWGLFWSLLGSLLDALGLIFTEKLIFHDFDMSKSTVCDTCASDFRPKSQSATPVQKKTITKY